MNMKTPERLNEIKALLEALQERPDILERCWEAIKDLLDWMEEDRKRFQEFERLEKLRNNADAFRAS